MNAVIELLKNHRSIRRFSDQAISAKLLTQLIEAGQMASTSSFIQSVSVVRVSNKEKREAFSELAGKQPYVNTAAEFLVFCADLHRNHTRASMEMPALPDYSWVEPFLAATVDVALFAQNVVVAAESEGLGCCYIGGIRNDPERVADLLQLPELVYPVFGLCLGYPEQNPECKPRLPVSSVLHQDVYADAQSHEAVLDDYDAFVKQYYLHRTKGKVDFTWSQQMAKQASSQMRPHMKKFLEQQGFKLK